MIALDLFAGAGGASLGLTAAGFSVIGVEADPEIARWHAENVGQCEAARVEDSRLREMRDCYMRPSILWASPPCQPHSYAGKRTGMDDPRDGFRATLEAIELLVPPHVVIENVRGSEPAMEWLAGELRARGYPTARVMMLDAADFGVPQRRRRVFITTGETPQPTHADPRLLGLVPRAPRPGEGERTQYDGERRILGPRPWETVRNALPELAREARVLGGGSNPGRGRGAWSAVRAERDLTDEPSTTIPAGGGNCFPSVELRIETGQTSERASGRVVHSTGIDDPCPTLRARNRGAPASVVSRPEWWHRGIVDVDEPARTIGAKGNATVSLSTAGSEPWRLDAPSCAVTCQDEKGTRASPSSGGRFNGGPDRASDVAYLAAGRRRLTVEECATLQGFPAGPPWHTFRTKSLAYRGVGNAVPPALAEAVARGCR